MKAVGFFSPAAFFDSLESDTVSYLVTRILYTSIAM
jgi:hypothetical protein